MKAQKENSLIKDCRVIWKFIRMINGFSPTAFLSFVFYALIHAGLPAFLSLIPKILIDAIQAKTETAFVIGRIIIVLGISISLRIIEKILDFWRQNKIETLNMRFVQEIGSSMMQMPYEKLEDPKIMTLREKASDTFDKKGGIYSISNTMIEILSGAFSVISYFLVIVLLGQYAIVFFIILFVSLNIIYYDKIQKNQFKYWEMNADNLRDYRYYRGLTCDFQNGIDIRQHHIAPLIMRYADKTNQNIIGIMKQESKQIGKMLGVSSILQQIQAIGAYIILTYNVYTGSIGVGSFVTGITACIGFSNSLASMLKSIPELRMTSRYLKYYFDLLDEADLDTGYKLNDKLASPLYNTEIVVEFKNVSFSYPRSENQVLNNISFSIKKGEKISLVGRNGSGKTTIVKLLTRLYAPTEGLITVNGVDINTYSLSELWNNFAVVFQDFKIFPFTVEDNVALNNSNGKNKITEALKRAGLLDKVESLPKAGKTCIAKIFEDDGVILSGGEEQKLAIARAIFQDAPIVILDEPTAALDPIAESEIFTRFNELMQGKTTLYISHRMSSCQFCDKILVLDAGHIVQCGTHMELISQHEGLYYNLFMTQANYYKKD